MIPQLLLLTGAPASGKTQLAGRLVERYGACGCSKDEIKELLFDHLGERDAAWSGRLSARAERGGARADPLPGRGCNPGRAPYRPWHALGPSPGPPRSGRPAECAPPIGLSGSSRTPLDIQ